VFCAPKYGDHEEVRRVRHNGEIKWQGHTVYTIEALTGEPVGCQPRPSLRAQGSRERAPDDKLREAIHAWHNNRELLRRLRSDASNSAISPHDSREFCREMSQTSEAGGNARNSLRPQPAHAK
jgi:hypothetical protein